MQTGILHRTVLCATIILVACSPGPSEEPSAVLEKAATKAQTLDSASFRTHFSYSTENPPLSLSGEANGSLADGGRQLSFSFDVAMTTPGDGVDQTVSVAGDVVVADEHETYLRLDRVTGSVPMLPGIGLAPTEMLGSWLLIGSSPGANAVTPDPSYLAMQTEILTVTKDRSYEKVDGRDCYAYDVTIDRANMLSFLERTAGEQSAAFDRAGAEKFLSTYEARGTIWIDAETYVIREITWSFENVDGTPAMDASLNVQLSEHGEKVEISPPADAVPFSNALDDSSMLLF